MIIVTGPAKVGKTSAIGRFVSHFPEWRHIVGSHILKAQGRPIADLSAADAAANQKYIKTYLENIDDLKRSIFDGHFLIKINEGGLLVSPNIMQNMGVTDVIFVEICEQRSLDHVANQGSSRSYIELTHSSEVARSLKARHHHVSGNDLAEAGRRLYSVLIETKVAVEEEFS